MGGDVSQRRGISLSLCFTVMLMWRRRRLRIVINWAYDETGFEKKNQNFVSIGKRHRKCDDTYPPTKWSCSEFRNDLHAIANHIVQIEHLVFIIHARREEEDQAAARFE
jgi:hypothetical protein